MEGASYLDLTKKVIHTKYGSNFNRTLIFQTLTNQIIDLD